MQFQIPGTPLPIYHSASGLRKATKVIPSTWGPGIHGGDLEEIPDSWLWLGPAQVVQRGHSGAKMAEQRSLSVTSSIFVMTSYK